MICLDQRGVSIGFIGRFKEAQIFPLIGKQSLDPDEDYWHVSLCFISGECHEYNEGELKLLLY